MLGIDIARCSLNILELSHKKNDYCIEYHSSLLLPVDIVSNGQIIDIDEVASCLLQMIKSKPVSCKYVALAIPDTVVMRKVVLMSASLTKKDIESLVCIEVEQLFSVTVDQLYVDFHILSKDSIETEMLNILIVATKSDIIKSRLNVVSRLGLKAIIVEAESSAVARVYQQWLTEDAPLEHWVHIAATSRRQPLRFSKEVDSERLILDAPNLLTACGLALRTRYVNQ